MALADMLPTFDDAALLNLRSNAERLAAQPGARHDDAATLLPLIAAELADREAKRPPPKAVNRSSRKTAATS